MKTPVKLLLLVLVLSGKLHAQLSNYYFSSESRAYVPITGTAATYGSFDEGRTGLLPIGFSFNYNGTNYTDLEASTNGFVRLGALFTHSDNMSYFNLSQSAERPLLAPLWTDLSMVSAGAIRYETTGTNPNRIFTIQWNQVKWSYNAMNPSIEFQIKLYETSNKIEFTYNQLAGAVSSGQAIIGISAAATGAGNYLNLSNSSSTPTVSSTTQSYVSTRPATNQVYAFYRPMPCIGTPVGGTTVSNTTTVCANNNFILSVQGSTLATGLIYQWRWSADGNTWNTIAGATDDSLITSQTTDRYYTRIIECAGNSSSSTPIFVTSAELTPSYASLPFTENFEATWISNCALRELPGANWKNTPVTGHRSWRREDDPHAAGWDYTSGWIGGNSSHAARFKVRDNYSTTDHGTGNLDLYVNCSGTGAKELRFKHIVTNAYSPLTVLYSTDGGLNFTSLGKIRGISQWREHNFVIPSNSVSTVIRFQGAGQGFSGSSDVGLDDVRVLVVSCNFPATLTMTNVQQTSATGNWSAVAGASGYEYHISTNPIPPASGSFTTAITTDFSGLASNTNYYLHVRSKCSGTDFSSWSTKAFTTSTDCSVALPLTCGTPRTFSVADGYGVYDLSATDTLTNCNAATFGKEQLFRFAPQISGVYSLRINSTNANYSVYYYIKNAADGCSPLGWKCVGNTSTATTFSLGNLIAGREYFIMLDLYTIVNGHAETIEIICPTANPDCISTTISSQNPVMCAGTTQVLSTNAGLGSYQWYRNGVEITGATSNTYNASLAGVYSVAATNLSCTSLPASPTYLTINSNPVPPAISAVGNVLTSSYTSSNQWFLDGSMIIGATAQSYTATTGGVYTVQVTVGGCSSTSANFNLVPTAVDNVSIWGKEVSVFPNPVESNLNIKNPGNKKLKLQLVDGIGRVVYEGTLIYNSGSVNLKHLPGGAYQLLITDVNKKQTVSRLILKN